MPNRGVDIICGHPRALPLTDLRDMKTQLDRRVQEAYTSICGNLQPLPTDRDRSWLIAAATRQDWDQVLINLNLYAQAHELSEDVQRLLKKANRLEAEYDAEGLRRALNGMCYDDKKVIGECLVAAVEGPFFPDCEFETLIALARDEVAGIARCWPDVDVDDSRIGLAINNVMNWLRAYPHQQYDRWSEYISVTPDEMSKIYHKWRALSGREDNRPSGTAEFFRNME